MTKPASSKTTLTIRIGKKQKQSWKSRAAKAGMSLTGLIRYVVDHTDVSLLMVAKRDEHDDAIDPATAAEVAELYRE